MKARISCWFAIDQCCCAQRSSLIQLLFCCCVITKLFSSTLFYRAQPHQPPLTNCSFKSSSNNQWNKTRANQWRLQGSCRCSTLIGVVDNNEEGSDLTGSYLLPLIWGGVQASGKLTVGFVQLMLLSHDWHQGRRTERAGGPLNKWNRGYQATCRIENLGPLSALGVGLSPADQRWFVTQVLFKTESEKNQDAGPSLGPGSLSLTVLWVWIQASGASANPFTTSFPGRSSS